MIDLMIVDDDRDVRERLKATVDFAAYGFRVICEAGDSDAARELFLFHRPKVVIMDINIPIISGIELAQEFAGIDSAVRFIIITGYGDFEHVKSSVKLGAVDLISKPVLPEEIHRSLFAAAEYFRQMREQQAASQLMSELLSENRPMLLKQALSDVLLLGGRGVTAEQKRRLAALGFELLGRQCAVVIMSAEPGPDGVLDFDLMLVATKNIAEELLSQAGFAFYNYYDDSSSLISVVLWDGAQDAAALEGAVRLTCEKLAFYFGISLVAGISRPASGMEGLPGAYGEARVAVCSTGAVDGDRVVNFRDVEQIDAPVMQDAERTLRELSLLFKSNRSEDIARLIGGYYASLGALSPGGGEKAREFAFACVARIVAEGISLGLGSPAINTRLADTLRRISAPGGAQLAPAALIAMIEGMLAELHTKRSQSKNQLIALAKEYINENLSNSGMNLDMVGSHVGLSSVYFSKLFHKEAGISFNDYLNNARIDKAKRLLSGTVLKVYEVGEAVGYSNTKYFNYVFKRLSGLTPLEYKNSSGGDI